jgi:hypothetical protein
LCPEQSPSENGFRSYDGFCWKTRKNLQEIRYCRLLKHVKRGPVMRPLYAMAMAMTMAPGPPCPGVGRNAEASQMVLALKHNANVA